MSSINQGLFTPYPVNRLLTKQEKIDRLYQGKPHPEGSLVHDDDTVIKMNSTYLETIDRYYTVKGFASLLCFGMAIGFLVCLIWFISICFNQHVLQDEPLDSDEVYLILFYVIGLFLMICICLKIVLKEWFRKTHYPIRFNRKNKMVYIYQVDGTILSVPWSDIFFTPCEGKFGMPGWGINGHILADDKETVLKTFSLGFFDLRYNLSGYWEFIRCYMEEDVLDELSKTIFLCPPIAEQKESYIFGLQYSIRGGSKFNWLHQFPLFPYSVLEAVARYVATQTSKIPQWPEDVEKACQVMPDDPIDVSYKNNSPHLWRYVFSCLKKKDYLKFYKQKGLAVRRIRRKVARRHKTLE
ncbi:DUF6708 domain-containing protein [Xenorhabdus szentirmaii]|uniref:DUF6708 domain-containing protein n=1 Tax=Xenorhabdus szentirmaii TaxID=290112 RepID=A0AAW3Z0H9_9GAMM|nr:MULTISPECIES: DUF6708 domain-containing protein [unclassified Xenorhabdus]MBD2781762.1 hypothetical protein [Xenorhabdus sp. 38]MBD2802532.1 hypothetical protein [Xenorhabdus sp. M]